jgi:hypothetical protein
MNMKMEANRDFMEIVASIISAYAFIGLVVFLCEVFI